MSIEQGTTEKQKRKGVVLRLNTLQNSRKSLSRILRMYIRRELDERDARTLAYLFEKLLGYWKIEKDVEFEKRIEAIEEKLQ